MKWIIESLNIGDHIRVKRSFYFHHGVYIGNDQVVHYSGKNDDDIAHPENVSILQTTSSFFAKGGIIEKALLDHREKKFKKNNEEIVKYAIRHLGEKGYDYLHHNCEDFANECCYKKKLSSQIDELKKKL